MFTWQSIVLLTLVTSLNTICAISFKFSTLRYDEHLLGTATLWFMGANTAALLAATCFQQLLRYMPLNLAFAFSGALWFLCVPILGARLIFHEAIVPVQWVGVVLLVAAIALISLGIKE